MGMTNDWSCILQNPLRKIIKQITLLIYFSLIMLGCLALGRSTLANTLNSDGIQIYQKSLNIDRKQKIADDMLRYRTADNLWDVLRDEFTLPHYENNPAVQAKIQWFMNNPDFVLRSALRAAPYLYYILQQVHKRHLPAELVLLPIIESGYNPFAYSNVGAAGIWQMMPSAASDQMLRQDGWYDGRRDVIASTRAALNYLVYLQTFFDGNWLLAMAAYNTGPGNVLSAIRRNISAGYDTDFWSLPVAQQTKDYVPSLLALATIISHPDQYPLYFPPVRNAPYLAEVDIGNQINLQYAANLAGISMKKMTQLNPGFRKPNTSPDGPYRIVLPIESVEQFFQNLNLSPYSKRQAGWVHYAIHSGDSLKSIARKFQTTTVAIKKMNHLGSHLPRPGSQLLIPHSTTTVTEKSDEQPLIEVAENNFAKHTQDTMNSHLSNHAHYQLQAGDTIHVVRKGETLEKIAKHFHIHSSQLSAANDHIKKVKVGQRVTIPTHQEKMMVEKSESVRITPDSGTPKRFYKVKRGDRLEAIARQFSTTPAAIRVANLLETNELETGMELLIPKRASA